MAVQYPPTHINLDHIADYFIRIDSWRYMKCFNATVRDKVILRDFDFEPR